MRWEDLNLRVYLRNGEIVFDNSLAAFVEESGGNFETLLIAIENNIVTTDDGEEAIDWPNVESDYDKMVQDPEWTNNWQRFQGPWA